MGIVLLLDYFTAPRVAQAVEEIVYCSSREEKNSENRLRENTLVGHKTNGKVTLKRDQHSHRRILQMNDFSYSGHRLKQEEQLSP
jgi:hypothetical protein